jgi:hypothetical protein
MMAFQGHFYARVAMIRLHLRMEHQAEVNLDEMQKRHK